MTTAPSALTAAPNSDESLCLRCINRNRAKGKGKGGSRPRKIEGLGSIFCCDVSVKCLLRLLKESLIRAIAISPQSLMNTDPYDFRVSKQEEITSYVRTFTSKGDFDQVLEATIAFLHSQTTFFPQTNIKLTKRKSKTYSKLKAFQ